MTGSHTFLRRSATAPRHTAEGKGASTYTLPHNIELGGPESHHRPATEPVSARGPTYSQRHNSQCRGQGYMQAVQGVEHMQSFLQAEQRPSLPRFGCTRIFSTALQAASLSVSLSPFPPRLSLSLSLSLPLSLCLPLRPRLTHGNIDVQCYINPM